MCAKWALLGLALVCAGAAQAAPAIDHWTLKNGARVYFVRSTELPMVQIEAVFDAASSRDPSGRAGLANLTNRLLQEGAGGLDADQIAARLDDLGAQYSASCDRDMATVTLRSLSDPGLMDPAVRLLALILRRPTFPVQALDRERERLLVALQEQQQSPQASAEKALYLAVYGDHPYAHEPIGDAADLKAIARPDLQAFHDRYYVGANAVLAIVGDLTSPEARRLSQRLLGDLPAGEAAPPLPAVAPLAAAAERVIAFPSTQAHIDLGQPGMRRLDPDYFPLYVGNYILGGGGLVSRLSEEIREKRGLSYSVYSYFWPLRQAGPFIMGLQTQYAQRRQALDLMRRTLADFVARGPTPAELTAAKKNLTGGFALRIDSDRKIADYLALIGFYGLPLTYLRDFVANVDAVTAAEVRAAFQRHIQPDRLVTVIVGGPQG